MISAIGRSVGKKEKPAVVLDELVIEQHQRVELRRQMLKSALAREERSARRVIAAARHVTHAQLPRQEVRARHLRNSSGSSRCGECPLCSKITSSLFGNPAASSSLASSGVIQSCRPTVISTGT